MGWREREWAKFTDDEWKRIVGPRADAPAGRSHRATHVTLLAALATLLATIAGILFHVRTTLRVPARAPARTNVLNVRWRASDLAPAPTAGQVCLTAPATGRVCAGYTAGERPADVLTALLRADGVDVRSS